MPKNPIPRPLPDPWKPDPQRAFDEHDPDLEPYASISLDHHSWWARAKVGRDRVFWVVVEDMRLTFRDVVKVVAQGYTTTTDEAERAALEAANAAGLRTERQAAGWAESEHSRQARGRRSARSASGSGTRAREFLYSSYAAEWNDFRNTVYAHPILKKTPRKYFVAGDLGCPLEELGTDREIWSPDQEAVVLDRAKLERDGQIYSRRHFQTLYLTPEEALGSWAQPAPCPAFDALGLEGDVTSESVKAAYRRKVKESHPDKGGSEVDFRAIESAYREALSYCERAARQH